MTTKELIKKLDSKYLSGKTMAEVKQRLLEYGELQRLVLDTMDSQEAIFSFMMSVLRHDLEGNKIEYFQEEFDE